MNPTAETLEELRQRGLRALADELGPDGLIRFLQLYQSGRGDFTQERQALPQPGVQSLAEEIRRKKVDTPR